ncbi:MAG: Crp/Fnr family transcriptional regulator [Alphaproteobacteria bacterium]|nr:Crp/Fnr family transcriptional regulator [Alphaproteobacteria bacterium]
MSAKLESIALFSDLPTDALNALDARCVWRNYAPGQQILHHRDQSRDVFLIASGTVRVATHAVSGRELNYRDIGTGEIFGEFAAIDGQPRSAGVVALSTCRIGMISANDFWSILRSHAEVAEAMLKHLTKLVRLYSERLLEFATLPISLRLRIELIRLARLGSREGISAIIEPSPTHIELASRIGTHRESVTRELTQLRREGLVESERKRIVICDIDRFEQIVCRAAGESLID